MPRRWLILVVVAGAVTVALVATATLYRPAAEVPALPDLSLVDAPVRELLERKHDLVSDNPRQASAWFELGQALDANEMDIVALRCYDQAQSLGLDRAELYYHRAAVGERLGRLEQAEQDLRRAGELAPSSAPARWRLGFALLDLARLDEAEASFRQAIKIDFHDVAGWIGLARVHLEQGKAAQAVEVLQKVRPTAGAAAPYVWHLLSIAYRAAGQPESARQAAARSAAAVPVWPDPWRERLRELNPSRKTRLAQGRELMDAGKIEQAIALLTALRRDWPDEPSVGTNLGTALSQAGRLPESISVLEQTVKDSPTFAPAHVAMATALMFQSLKPEPLPNGWRPETLRVRAVAHANKALELNPGFGMAHALRGSLAQQGGDLAGALREYQEAVRCEPGNGFWSRTLAELQLNLGRFDEALATCDLITQRDPQSAIGFWMRGVALMRLGRPGEAEASLRQADQLKPGDPGIRSALAEATRAASQGTFAAPRQ